MKILVIGAGVLGSLYAARLHESGFNVTVLARGKRLEEIRQQGLVLEEADSGERLIVHPHVIDRLDPDDAYDLALVLVRKNQVPSLLPTLAANRQIPSVVFMVNNAEGPQPLVEALGREQVLMGFPGAGGERQGHVVRYHVVSDQTQPTTMGELGGQMTTRLFKIGTALRAAGFPVDYSSNIDAWLKTHVALVSPIANALYLAGGDNYRLSRTRDGLVLMVRAVREGLRVLQALSIPITPVKYRWLRWIPEPLVVGVMQRAMNTPRAELVMARHANAARDEMQQLSDEFQRLVEASGLATPNIDRLRQTLSPASPTLPDGSRELALDWRQVWAALGLLAGLGFMIALGRRKGRCCS